MKTCHAHLLSIALLSFACSEASHQLGRTAAPDSGTTDGDTTPDTSIPPMTETGTGAWHLVDRRPPASWFHSAVLDEPNARLLVFGGWTYDGLAGAETWALSLDGASSGTWSQVQLADDKAPWPRAFHTAAVDERNRRMLVYGGYGPWTDVAPSDRLPTDDVLWALSLDGPARWSILETTGPKPNHSSGVDAIYDPASESMLFVGGAVTRLTLTGTPAFTVLTSSAPMGIDAIPPVLDPVEHRLLAFTLRDDVSPTRALKEIWALPLEGTSAWTKIFEATTVIPIESIIYDTLLDRLLAVSARDTQYVVNFLRLREKPLAWTNDPQPEHGIGLDSFSTIWDSKRRQLIFIGGADAKGLTNRVRVLLVGGWWMGWNPGAPASPADLHYAPGSAAAWDTARRRAIVHGGFDGNGPVKDVVVSSGEGWSSLATGTGGPALTLHSAIHEPVGDRLILFGGYDAVSKPRNDVFALDAASSWSSVSASGAPPTPRGEHAAAYDPSSGAMLIYGGHDAGHAMNDLWSLSLGSSPAWTELHPAGAPPPPVQTPRGAYDPASRRWYVFPEKDRVFALSLDRLEWTELSPLGALKPGTVESVAFEAARKRLVVLRASPDTHRLQVWALETDPVLRWVELCPNGPGPGNSSSVFDTGNGLFSLGGGSWRLDSAIASCTE